MKQLVSSLTLLSLAACASSTPCPSVDPGRLATAIHSEWNSRRVAEPPDTVLDDETDDYALDEELERIAVPVTNEQPSRGPADALVTIVVFSDFQCPFCARVLPTLAAIQERYGNDVRIVFRNLPLPFHEHAALAAEAAREAFLQGGNSKFWAMHDRFFDHDRSTLEPSDLERAAVELGLDVVRFRRALDEHTHLAAVVADQTLAARVGANGTPTFFINGMALTGAQPLEAFARRIDAELVVARELVSQGIPRENVYASVISGAPDHITVAEPERDPDEPDPTLTYRVPVGDVPVRGPADALVTMVIFSDFQCPFCSRVVPTLDALRTRYGRDIRFVFMNNPLPFHDRAEPAAEAAFEVFRQRGAVAFWQYHDTLFANQTALDAASLETYAARVRVNVVRFRSAMESHRHRPTIESQQALGQRLGARGTPSFFINGRFLAGAYPEETFATLIDGELAEARALVASGVRRQDVYARIMRDALESLGIHENDVRNEGAQPSAPNAGGPR